MAFSVLKPAVASPGDSPRISVSQFYKEQLAKRNVILIPSSFEKSGDPTKVLGEQAEEKVINAIENCCRDIPGIEIICIHGVRVIGDSPSIIREVDQCVFLRYQGRHYVVVTEVKCNANAKKSGGTRKKAVSQLKTFISMLGSELNVQTDQLQVHTV